MDPDHRYMPKRELLTIEEYATVARACAKLGISKLRVTGGEPTLHPAFDDLLGELTRSGFSDVALTTNGSRLDAAAARRWRSRGLRRITLSLDSLDDERVRRITRTRSTAATVVRAIEAARRAGLAPIKVNAVIMRGINDDEVEAFASFARHHDIDMRFIEWMPLDSGRTWSRDVVVSADEILARIRTRHELVAIPSADEHATACEFGFADGGPGRIGVIASVTRPFCGACSRLRITADGKVRPCLFSHTEWDLRPLLRSDRGTPGAIAQFIADAMWTKQAGHGIGASTFAQPERSMSAIGG
jgi:cyclic pyranopterin phosphate synthase